LSVDFVETACALTVIAETRLRVIRDLATAPAKMPDNPPADFRHDTKLLWRSFALLRCLRLPYKTIGAGPASAMFP
jgi:hypothetical protein